MATDESSGWLLKIALFVMFFLGAVLIITSAIGVMRFGFDLSGTFSPAGGSLLMIFSIIIYMLVYSDIGPITFKGERYALERQNSTHLPNDGDGEIETVIPILREISEEIESHDQDLSPYYNTDAIQACMKIIDEQLAIREYTSSVNSENGMRVLGFDSQGDEYINAQSEDDMNLSRGLLFHLLSDEGENSTVNGRIATAELVETESTPGDLFQFVIHEWRRDEEQWKSRAIEDIRNGRARLTIITDDLVDVEKEALETTLQCLQTIKHHQELDYGY